MIKKLRRKIILTNMALVGAVLLAVFAVICVNSWRIAGTELEGGLVRALNTDLTMSIPNQSIGTHRAGDAGAAPDGSFSAPDDVAGLNGIWGRDFNGSYVATVTVTVDADGNIIETRESGAEIDSAVLAEAVDAVLSSGKDSGALSDLGLAYMTRETPGGTVIALADSSAPGTALRSELISSGILFLASMAVLLLISLWLSGLAVKPVAEAWDRQRQFVADASHELKTPLTVILANNSIMRSHKNETIASQGQWLESTEEEAGRMRCLVEELLTLARADAVRAKPALSDTELSRLCEEELLYFEPVAFEKGVGIDSAVESDVMAVTEAGCVKQILRVLLDNAVKYAPAGTAVTVALKKIGSGAEISVNNLGETIEPSELEHIFDRFYRGDKARSEGGFGLGLSIARDTALSINARLAAESSPEKGTTFRFTI